MFTWMEFTEKGTVYPSSNINRQPKLYARKLFSFAEFLMSTVTHSANKHRLEMLYAALKFYYIYYIKQHDKK